MNEPLGPCAPANLPDQIKQALNYWIKLKGDREIPSRSMFDPLDVPPLLPHILLVEVIRGAEDLSLEDFRFRVVGTYVNERMKGSYTGKKLSEIEDKGPGSDIWNAYSEVQNEKKPKIVSLNYVGPVDGINKSWEVFLPFSGESSLVDFILVVLVFE